MLKTIDRNAISIYDGETAVLGADQKWFAKLSHSISGCGPATAALILKYMAAVFPERCRPLYPYELPARKNDFAVFMSEVRQFVKPGLRGLTDDRFFASSTVAFAKAKGVALTAYRLSPTLSVGVACGFVEKAIDQGYMPALLILKNPARELHDLTWHWMAITGYDNDKRTVLVTSNGAELELSFDSIWNQKKPYKARCVYFYPE